MTEPKGALCFYNRTGCWELEEKKPEYKVLYRKYRPKTFDEVVGQKAVTVTLANEVKTGKTTHAYLFTGSRGTGKTTCAKILAKAVNCLAPVDGNPCNQCENCKGIEKESEPDVIEMDAASHNGVDDVRNIIDETNYTPVRVKNRVYIIDEVHMFTPSAFNAFLKTLEEPPEHVVFILATTDVHKLPPTVRSRCQRFDFIRVRPEDIVERLLFVASREGFALDNDAAILIARISDGSLRDALSLLDVCSVKGKTVTEQLVRDAAGLADKSYLFDITGHIRNNDTAEALRAINDLHGKSCDLGQFLSELANHFRDLMVAKTVKSPKTLLVLTPGDTDRLARQARLFDLEDLMYCLSELEKAFLTARGVENPRIVAEMTVVRLCSPSMNESNESLLKRIAALEAAAAGKAATIVAPPSAEPEPADEPNPPIEHEPVPLTEPDQVTLTEPEPAPLIEPGPLPEPEADIPAAREEPERFEPKAPAMDGRLEAWPEVLEDLKNTNRALANALAGCPAREKGAQLHIGCAGTPAALFLSNPLFLDHLSASILRVTGKKLTPVATEYADNAGEEADDFRLEDFMNKLSDLDE